MLGNESYERFVETFRNFPTMKNILDYLNNRTTHQKPKSLEKSRMQSIWPWCLEGFHKPDGILNFLVRDWFGEVGTVFIREANLPARDLPSPPNAGHITFSVESNKTIPYMLYYISFIANPITITIPKANNFVFYPSTNRGRVVKGSIAISIDQHLDPRLHNPELFFNSKNFSIFPPQIFFQVNQRLGGSITKSYLNSTKSGFNFPFSSKNITEHFLILGLGVSGEGIYCSVKRCKITPTLSHQLGKLGVGEPSWLKTEWFGESN